MSRCNPYGWENAGGPNPAGGLLADTHTVDDSKRWHCGAEGTHRYVWVCSHDNIPPGQHLTLSAPGASARVDVRRLADGHRSAEPFHLCDRHAQLLKDRVGRQLVPCPRCVAIGPDHKCWLRLEMTS